MAGRDELAVEPGLAAVERDLDLGDASRAGEGDAGEVRRLAGREGAARIQARHRLDRNFPRPALRLPVRVGRGGFLERDALEPARLLHAV